MCATFPDVVYFSRQSLGGSSPSKSTTPNPVMLANSMKLWAFLVGCTLLASACSPYTLHVEAGDFDRHNTVVPFSLPAGAGAQSWELRAPNGAVMPVQLEGNGRASFILGHLGAGRSLELRLEPAGRSHAQGVEADLLEGLVHFGASGQPIVRYHADKRPMPRADIDPVYHRNGYLHPVFTPSGRMVTDDYPPNHIHHHGIWAAWTHTEFQGRTPDFWNMGQGAGRVDGVALDTLWSGPVHGGLQARHQYVDLTAPTPVVALFETWTMRVYATPGGRYNIFDLALTQTTATDSALHLPTYRYGGVGVRGHRDWNGEENTGFLTSAGMDRSNGHATRARWCHVGGLVEGELAGIAILSHPDNFVAPQPMRIHPTEPFFNYAPSQAGDFSILPGAPYEARYRFVVYDGPPDAAELDRLWNDYAHPPVARVEP